MELRITRLWHSEGIHLSLSDEHRPPPSPSSQTSSRWRGKEVTTMLQLTVKKNLDNDRRSHTQYTTKQPYFLSSLGWNLRLAVLQRIPIL
jgi:hypothetical protein